MIYFITTSENRYTIDRYLAFWGRVDFPYIVPMTYAYCRNKEDFPPGTYIFSDIELLSKDDRETALKVCNHLSQDKSKYVVINSPYKSLGRYDLQKNLEKHKINHFRVWRLKEHPSNPRSPVFLRREKDHAGGQSGLLHTDEELKNEISNIIDKEDELNPWMIVEYCDTIDQDGIYRKYSAFLINGQIIPRHIIFSKNWVQKYFDIVNDALIKEEMDYIEQNPHEKELKSIFDLAKIEYGRIDYSLQKGSIQVWEINTNPMIVSAKNGREKERIEVHQQFFNKFSPMLQALSGGKNANTERHAVMITRIQIIWEKTKALALFVYLKKVRPKIKLSLKKIFRTLGKIPQRVVSKTRHHYHNIRRPVRRALRNFLKALGFKPKF